MINKTINSLLNPLYYFVAYFFIATTTLHHQFEFLLKIHIELIVLLTLIFTIIRSQNCFKDKIFWQLTLFSLSMIVLPLISSVLNNNYLSILMDGEFNSYAQTLILIPFIFCFVNKYTNRKTIFKVITLINFILSLYFEYRYIILDEIREFDSRPLLKIRHGDANFLCTILSFAIPFGMFVAKDYFKSNQVKNALIWSFITINIFIASLLTQSRMGLIALAISLCFLFLKKEIKINKSQSIILITSLIISLFIFGSSLTNRFENIADKSNSDRILTYINGFKIIENSPYFGVGMHNAKEYFYENTQYPHFQSEFHRLDIHNTYLKIFAEIGFFSFAFLIYLIFVISKKSLFNKNEDKNYIFSSLLVILISSLTIGIPYKDFYLIELIIIYALANNIKSGESNV